MIGDHHGRTAGGTILLVRAVDTILGTHSVTRLRFEAFTLGTLAVIIAFAVIGYWLGRPVREQEADVALVAPAPV